MEELPGQPVGDGGDPYTGYDRFGRTEQMLWGRPQEGGGFEGLAQVQSIVSNQQGVNSQR